MDDQGTFLTIGGGLVTIVVLATAFSSFMESRSVRADAKAETRIHVEEDRVTIERLELQVANAKAKWIEASARKEQKASCEVGKRAVAERRNRLAELRAKKTELGASLAKSEAEFVRYRSDYRVWTWNAAAGESIGNLRTIDGKEYQGVVISKVTDEGLEIRHAHGVARVRSDQLVESWQRRFQWGGQTAVSVSK